MADEAVVLLQCVQSTSLLDCLPCILRRPCKKSCLAWAPPLLRNYQMHTISEECRCIRSTFSMQFGIHDHLSSARPSARLDPAFGCVSILLISQCLLTQTPMVRAAQNLNSIQNVRQNEQYAHLLQCHQCSAHQTAIFCTIPASAKVSAIEAGAAKSAVVAALFASKLSLKSHLKYQGLASAAAASCFCTLDAAATVVLLLSASSKICKQILS